MRKIGIMGGTFNPIHMAHLILAENAYEQLKLDKVLFMPSKKPPHKLKENITADEHRLKMVQLAIEGNPHFEVSAVELKREGTTYTAETLEQLKAEYPEDEFYFILGADSLFQMEDWWRPDTIFELAHIVAAVRDHVKDREMKEQVTYLYNKFKADIHLLDTPNMDISSKKLREDLKTGKSIRYYIPDAVLKYIKKHHLYQDSLS